MTDAEIVRAGLEAVDDSPDWNAVRLGFAALDRITARLAELEFAVREYRDKAHDKTLECDRLEARLRYPP